MRIYQGNLPALIVAADGPGIPGVNRVEPGGEIDDTFSPAMAQAMLTDADESIAYYRVAAVPPRTNPRPPLLP